MLENLINEILYYIILVIEVIGVCVIVFGIFYAVCKLILNNCYNIKNKYKNNMSVKLALANYLALGLEFLLGAEILSTVTIERNLSQVLVLGIIIILRIIMRILISWEVSWEVKNPEIILEDNKNNDVKPL